MTKRTRLRMDDLVIGQMVILVTDHHEHCGVFRGITKTPMGWYLSVRHSDGACVVFRPKNQANPFCIEREHDRVRSLTVGRLDYLVGDDGSVLDRMQEALKKRVLPVVHCGHLQRKWTRVHRLVWLAFRGTLPRGWVIDHIARESPTMH